MSLAHIFKQQLNRLPIFRQIEVARAELEAARRDLRSEQDAFEREKKRIEELAELAAKELAQAKTWVAPGHYYSPIPSLEDVKRRAERIFVSPDRLTGIDLRDREQLELLQAISAYYPEMPFPEQLSSTFRYFFENPHFSYSDACILYCMIRHIRPKRIIEVGSGYSSCLILDTNEHHFQNRIRCRFIEPFPELLLKLIRPEDQDNIEVIPSDLQEAPVEGFMSLEENDILFIDSTHVSKTGSDVNFILFQILPILKRGVWIHFHDIFFPFEYPPRWVYQNRSWNEAYILRAFLQNNPAYRIELFSSQMTERHPRFFEQSMSRVLLNDPGSIWLRKIAEPDPADVATVLTAPRFRPGRRIDLAEREIPLQLGLGWHESEGKHRWMGRRAEVRIGGPRDSSDKLRLVGYTQAQSSVMLTVIADSHNLGCIAFPPGQIMEHELPIPAELVGLSNVRLVLKADSTFRGPGDVRDLSIAFGTVEIR